MLKDSIAESLLWAIDKPLRPSLIKDIVESINAKFREMKAAGLIIGAEAFYRVENNPNDQLAGGKVVIDFTYTPVPPLENLTIRQQITDSYFADFALAA